MHSWMGAELQSIVACADLLNFNFPLSLLDACCSPLSAAAMSCILLVYVAISCCLICDALIAVVCNLHLQPCTTHGCEAAFGRAGGRLGALQVGKTAAATASMPGQPEISQRALLAACRCNGSVLADLIS